jgi:hypothetical protein
MGKMATSIGTLNWNIPYEVQVNNMGQPRKKLCQDSLYVSLLQVTLKHKPETWHFWQVSGISPVAYY